MSFIYKETLKLSWLAFDAKIRTNIAVCRDPSWEAAVINQQRPLYLAKATQSP